MNEVRVTQTAAPVVVSAASSKGAASPKAEVSGNTLPPKTDNQPVEDAPKAQGSVRELHTAVDKVNSFVQSIQRDLQFTVDKDLERTVIKVIDSDSGELIRQIPEDIFLELARRLNDDGEVRLMDALG